MTKVKTPGMVPIKIPLGPCNAELDGCSPQDMDRVEAWLIRLAEACKHSANQIQSVAASIGAEKEMTGQIQHLAGRSSSLMWAALLARRYSDRIAKEIAAKKQ